MALTRIHIQPDILRWAVTRAGKDVDEYASEHPKYGEWLDGKSDPTFSMAQKFAQKLYVPFGYLFLQEPPKEELAIPFFRKSQGGSQSLNISDTVNEMIDRQDWLSDYLRNNDFDKIPFIGKYKGVSDPAILSKAIHKELGLPINWAFDYHTVNDAINHLVQVMEDKGVVITFNSMVGNNTKRPLSVKECRGFCLVDDYAPFVFVNSKDAKGAQVFSLMHEFAHLLLGYSSGVGDNAALEHASDIERLCDSTAALTLVPTDLLAEEWTKTPYGYDVLARRFKVSRYVIARRANEEGYIAKERLFQLLHEWDEEPQTARSSGPVDFNVMAVRRNSRTFLIHLCNALDSHQILHSDAYRMVGLKPDTFHKVLTSKAFLK